MPDNKKREKMKKLNILVLTLVFLISIYNVKGVGIGFPIPNPINVAPGQEATFFFSIDSTSTDADCDISFQTKTQFEFEFYTLDKSYDKGEKIFTQKDKTTAVYGTAKIPSSAQFGEYKTTFCVSCKPTADSGGASAVLGSACGIPLNINVIGNPQGQIAFPQKPKQEGLSTVAFIGILVLVLLAFYAIYSGLKRKPTKKQKKK